MKISYKNIIPFIVPLTVMLIISRAFPVLSFLYYAVPIILILNLILTLHRSFIKKELVLSKELKLMLLMITAFGVWAAVTAFWSPYPEVSLSRAGYFLLISLSPLILGYMWRQYNKTDLFGFLLPANILVVIVSLYSLLTSTPDDAWTGGHGMGFMGYAGHQNTLASALIFTIPAVLYPLLKDLSGRVSSVYKNSKSLTRLPSSTIIFLSVLLILNLYLTLLSVSRAAILMLIVMILVYVALTIRFKIALVIILLFISVYAVLLFTVQPVKDFTFKTENTIGDRRKININETIDAAKNGGLFGIGYGISQTPTDSLTLGRYSGDEKRFEREKMISSLALLEETGIIGLIIFLLPVFYLLSLLAKKYLAYLKDKSVNGFIKRSDTAILISVLIALIFHAQIEGWWVGVGSVHLPIMYLVMSYEF